MVHPRFPIVGDRPCGPPARSLLIALIILAHRGARPLITSLSPVCLQVRWLRRNSSPARPSKALGGSGLPLRSHCDALFIPAPSAPIASAPRRQPGSAKCGFPQAAQRFPAHQAGRHRRGSPSIDQARRGCGPTLSKHRRSGRFDPTTSPRAT